MKSKITKVTLILLALTTLAASPAERFQESIVHGTIQEIPIVNSHNRTFIESHPTVKASFDLLSLPFNLTAKTQARELQSSLNFKLDQTLGGLKSNPNLGPALEEILEAYVAAQPAEAKESQAKPLERLRQELASTLAADRLNLNWATYFVPRLLAAQSCPSCDEIDLYEHVNPRESTYRLLFENETWKNHDEFKLLLGRNSLLNYNYTPWAQEVDQYVQKAITFPTMAYVFSMNQTFVNPIMLIASYLHHLFPVAVPKAGSQLGAHGIEKGAFSVFGFFYHDVFHAELFSKQRVLEYYLDIHIRKAMGKNRSIPKFVTEFAPLAAARYQGLLNLFQTILDTGMHDQENAAPNSESMKGFKAAVAGLFEGVHEYPSFTEKMLEQSSATQIIESFVTNAKQEIQSHLSWESAWNPLETTAVDGHTDLTDQQIVDVVLRLHKEQYRSLRFLLQEGVSEAGIVANAEAIYPILEADELVSPELKDLREGLKRLSDQGNAALAQIPALEVRVPAPQTVASARASLPLDELTRVYYSKLYKIVLDRTYRSKVDGVQVVRGSRYIDVIFLLKTGMTEKITYPTYFHKFKNSEDNFKLMKYAGKVDPDFQGLHDRAWQNPQDSKLVESYLSALQGRLVGVVDDFHRFALEIIQRPTPGGSADANLETAYREWIVQLDAQAAGL